VAQSSEAVPRWWIVGAARDRARVRGAAAGLALAFEEREHVDAASDLQGVQVVLVCGGDAVRAFAATRGPWTGALLIAGLAAGEAAAALPPGVDDYVALDAPDAELAARLGFVRARAADRATRLVDAMMLTEMADVVDELIGITTGDATRNLFLSRAYETITGAPRAAIMDQPSRYLELVHPDDHWILVRAHTRKHTRHEYQYRIERADGATRWLHSRSFPVTDGEGSTTRVVTITRDVTDRKLAEDDATAQRALLEGVTTALTTLHAAARTGEAMERALAILGSAAGVDRVYVARHHRDDAGELRVGLTHEWTSDGTDTIRSAGEGSGLEPALADARPMLSAIERGQSLAVLRSDLPPDVRLRLDKAGVRSMLIVPVIADGSCWGQVGFVDCKNERHWDASARAILEATAAAIGSAVMRERAMDALAEQVHRVRSLFESAANPALAARDQLTRMLEIGRSLLDVEVAGVLRIRPEDRDTCELVHVFPTDGPPHAGDRVPLARELWEPSIAENRPVAMADVVGTRYEGSDAHRAHGFRTFLGAPLWVRGQSWGGLVFLRREPTGRPFRETDLDLARLIAGGVAHLIEQMEAEDERRALDASLRETQKLESLGLLAGGVAHDFNNLLMSIMGHATLATRAGETDRATVNESLEQITAITRRAASLTRQLLAYAGRDRVRIEPMSLAQLVREMSELLAVVLPKDARLVNEIADDLAPVLGDAAQLQQVVMNLLTNAGDALAGRAGTITLRGSIVTGAGVAARPSGEAEASRYVLLEVTDDGVGMDEATREHIFEPFFTTKGAGRGLGLAAVLGIVRMHHGFLEVESAPGKGTTFRLCLPAAHAPPLARPPAVTTAVPTLPWRVLVVDDTAQIRVTIQRVLTMHGADVITGGDGVEAVEHVTREGERIDLVVLDLTMPRMDGARAHARIRELVPGMPIILMSGYAEGERVERALAEPRTHFLSKPFDAAELVSAIQALIAERHAL
jgi:PAS domain S-box-containing protein